MRKTLSILVFALAAVLPLTAGPLAGVVEDVDCRVFAVKDPATRGRAQQGMVMYGRYIFSCEDGGHVNVYDFRQAESRFSKAEAGQAPAPIKPVGGFELASSCPDNHANNAEFGIETKKGASFPLLYISNGKVGSGIEWTCYVESITRKGRKWSSEIAQTIILDGCNGWEDAGYTAIFGAPSWLVDRERGELWVFSAIKRTVGKVTRHAWENLYVATKFRIPALAEGTEVHLGVKDILDQVTFPYETWFTQAGFVSDGRIWYCFGVGCNDNTDGYRPPRIRVFDTDSRTISAKYDFDTTMTQEPEDMVLRDGWVYMQANTSARKGIAPVIYRISLPKALPEASGAGTGCGSHAAGRQFMAHRGCHLSSTLAGENSLEAIDMAKRAGFTSIETDCRYTADSVLVIIHDANINRTFVNADGSRIKGGKIAVSDLTFEQLRRDYRLKADREEFRTVIPTLREYLRRCRDNGLYVYIEPKLNDSTGRYYLDIIEQADEVLGRGNYTICSNNFANGVIRNTLGITDVPLMGLLYQTDWDTMEALGGDIRFALNPTKFDRETFRSLVARTRIQGMTNESATGLRSLDSQTNFDCFNQLLRLGDDIDVVATDITTPDYHGQGRTVAEFHSSDPAEIEARLAALPSRELYGIYVTLKYEGTAALTVGPDGMVAGPWHGGEVSYQRSVYDSVPSVKISGLDGDFRIKDCAIRIVEL